MEVHVLIPYDESMTPKFYLILEADDLTDELADAVYEAGFDDSSLVMRNGGAAIWVRHRAGELQDVMREAVTQAERCGLNVLHVEIESGALV
jgi:hypothetical protein